MKNKYFFASLMLLKKGVRSGVGSGSVSQRYGSAPKCHGSPTLVVRPCFGSELVGRKNWRLTGHEVAVCVPEAVLLAGG